MPYSVRHYASLEVVETEYSGLVTIADLRGATTQLVGLQRQYGITRFLVNLGNHEIQVAAGELEKLLDEQYWQEDVNRRSRIAIIQPERQSARAAAAFFVEACRKRGWQSEVLADRSAAMDWLARPGRN